MLFITGPLYSGKRTFAARFGGRQIFDVQTLAAAAPDLEKLADELAGGQGADPGTPLPGHGAPVTATWPATWDDAQAAFERELLGRLYPLFPSSRKLAARLATSHTMIANKLRRHGIPGNP